MEQDIATLNNYIAKSKCLVNDEYRLAYHMMPPIGWLNDPNGLIRFKGRYHLYYQFNPYASAPGRMCWGHFVSDDLISYIDDGVALKTQAPIRAERSKLTAEYMRITHCIRKIRTANGRKCTGRRQRRDFVSVTEKRCLTTKRCPKA